MVLSYGGDFYEDRCGGSDVDGDGGGVYFLVRFIYWGDIGIGILLFSCDYIFGSACLLSSWTIDSVVYILI